MKRAADAEHRPPPVRLLLSDDGQRVASIDKAGALRSWSFESVEARVIVRTPRATAIAFDGTTLLVGDARGHVRAVDASSGESLWDVACHRGAVSGVAMLNEELVSIGHDGALRIGPPTARKPRFVVQRGKPFTSLARAPNGDIAIASVGQSLTVWNLAGVKPVERFRDRSSWAPAEDVFFLDDGRTLLTTKAHCEMIWDLQKPGMLSGGGNSYRAFAASDPSRGRFAIARNDELEVKALSSRPRPRNESSSQAELVAWLGATMGELLASEPQVVAHVTLGGEACAVAIAGDRVVVGMTEGRVRAMFFGEPM